MLPYQGKNSLTRSAKKTRWSYCCILLSGDLQPCAGGACRPANSMEARSSIYFHACLKKAWPDPDLNICRENTAQQMEPRETTWKTYQGRTLFFQWRCCPFLSAWAFLMYLVKLVYICPTCFTTAVWPNAAPPRCSFAHPWPAASSSSSVCRVLKSTLISGQVNISAVLSVLSAFSLSP